ncbi:FUSC family protein [Modestobacter sp. SSW1-42]|uniref:FUSC family protein n=1 Tax=Modestobacter sp. SSW1-42 TaxID=596372 RepID=UPI00398784A9
MAHRVTGALLTVLQCGVASAAGWWMAEAILGHQQPVFAATAAVICLAAGSGGRARQAVDLLAGVLAGVLVGQLVRTVHAEPGVVGTLVAVTAAMLMVSLLDTRPLALIQAGSSALFVLVLPPVQTPFVRLLDAAVGGGIGLLVSQVLLAPDPVRLVLEPACSILDDVAAALRAKDAVEAAEHARSAITRLGQLTTTQATARDVAARTIRGRLRTARLQELNRDLADLHVLCAATILHTARPQDPYRAFTQCAEDLGAAADALGQPGGRAGGVIRETAHSLLAPDATH